jgi:hypothetical protein
VGQSARHRRQRPWPYTSRTDSQVQGRDRKVGPGGFRSRQQLEEMRAHAEMSALYRRTLIRWLAYSFVIHRRPRCRPTGYRAFYFCVQKGQPDRIGADHRCYLPAQPRIQTPSYMGNCFGYLFPNSQRASEWACPVQGDAHRSPVRGCLIPAQRRTVLAHASIDDLSLIVP